MHSISDSHIRGKDLLKDVVCDYKDCRCTDTHTGTTSSLYVQSDGLVFSIWPIKLWKQLNALWCSFNLLRLLTISLCIWYPVMPHNQMPISFVVVLCASHILPRCVIYGHILRMSLVQFNNMYIGIRVLS